MAAVTKIMGLVYKLMLTNLLGGSGMAVYSSVYAAFTPVYAVAVGGIPSAVAIMTAESFALARYKNARRIRRCAMLIFTLAGLFCSGLLLLTSGAVSRLLLDSDIMMTGLCAVAPTVVLCCIISVCRGYYEGLCDMVPTAVSEIIETVCKLILGLAFAFIAYRYTVSRFSPEKALSLTASASILGVSLSSLFAAVYLALRLKIKGDGITRKMELSDRCTDSRRYIIMQLMKTALPIALTAAISTFLNMVDLLTVPRMLRLMHVRGMLDIVSLTGIDEPSDAAGFIYGSFTALAMTVTGIVPGFTAMLGKPALPGITRARASGDKKALKKGLDEIYMLTSLIAFPASFGMTVFSRELLAFLFPGRAAEVAVSVIPCMIMSAGLWLGCFLPPLFALLQAAGRPKGCVRIMIVSCIVKLIMNVAFMSLPHVGVSGAAVSLVLSDLAAFILMERELFKALPVRPGIRAVIAPAFCALLCAVSARLGYDCIHIENSRLRLIAAVIIGGIIYIFSLYLLNIMPKKRPTNENFKKIAKKT